MCASTNAAVFLCVGLFRVGTRRAPRDLRLRFASATALSSSRCLPRRRFTYRRRNVSQRETRWFIRLCLVRGLSASLTPDIDSAYRGGNNRRGAAAAAAAATGVVGSLITRSRDDSSLFVDCRLRRGERCARVYSRPTPLEIRKRCTGGRRQKWRDISP